MKQLIILKDNVAQNKGNLTPKKFYLELLNWAFTLYSSKRIQDNQLYKLYFSYFENVCIEDYSFHPIWYDFNQMVDFFIRFDPISLERSALVVRDMLWEIVAFKTDRECKVLIIDNLRALTNLQKTEVFFSCDSCGYTENIEGNKITPSDKLYPATEEQILKYNIIPGKFNVI